ncbi:MAG: AAA family ATPase, partial [Acidimicrobiales bacterium]
MGRVAELRSLALLLELVETGRPQVVVAHGPAGIGKTALVREFLGGHPELRVVWASGDESEALLAFGVVDQMWRTSTAGGGIAPDAFRLDGVVDPLKMGAELLEAVAVLAADAPVALVVDDAHWADGPSLGAIAFALRRLVAERVLAVIVCRDELLGVLPPSLQRAPSGEGSVQLAVGGLGADDLAELAGLMGRTSLGMRAVRRLRDHTGGNPLHARALLEELGPEAFPDLDVGPLPAPAAFAAWVVGRLSRCSLDAQALLAGASVLGIRWRLDAAAALVGVDEPAAALDEVVGAGLVDVGVAWDGPHFAHPLIRATIYYNMAPGRRASLHAGAAASSPSRAESLRHRAAACLVEDPELAAEIAGFADEQEGRGAWAAAADGLLTANRLGPGADAERWLLAGVECLVQAGDTTRALAIRERVENCGPSARREYVRGFLAAVSGDRIAAKRLFDQAWSGIGSADRDVAAKVASQQAMIALNEGRGLDAVGWARRVLTANPRSRDRGIARAVEALGLGELGRFDEGMAAMGDWPLDDADFDSDRLGALLGHGVLRLWSGQLRQEAVELARAEDVARHLGPLYLRIIALFYLADAEYRLGRWAAASAHAELAVSLGRDAGEVWTLG